MKFEQWHMHTITALFCVAIVIALHSFGIASDFTMYLFACWPIAMFWIHRNADDARAALVSASIMSGIEMSENLTRQHVHNLTGLMNRALERIENAKDKNEIETMRKHALQWQLDGQEQVRGMVHELKDKAGNIVCRFEWSRKAGAWVAITPPIFLEMKVDAMHLMKQLNDIKAVLEHVEETTHAMRDVHGPRWDKPVVDVGGPVMPHADSGSAP
jgi:hypothetical protein